MFLPANPLLRASIATALLTIPAAAMAADEATDSEALETILVTGSHIAGAAQNAALPVTVLDRDEIARQGSPSVLDLMRSLEAAGESVRPSSIMLYYVIGPILRLLGTPWVPREPDVELVRSYRDFLGGER